MFGAGVDISYDNAWQAILALQPNEMVPEYADARYHAPRLIRQDIAPVFAGRCGNRGFDDLEVFAAIRIGANENPVFVRLDVIPDTCFARRHESRLRRGFRQIDQIGFRRVMVREMDDRVAARAAAPDTHEPARILLFEN